MWAYAVANKGSVCFYRNDWHIDKTKTSNFPIIGTFELEWNKKVNKDIAKFLSADPSMACLLRMDG